MKRYMISLFVILTLCPSTSYAQREIRKEIVVEAFNEDNLPVINEELRRINEILLDFQSRIGTLEP